MIALALICLVLAAAAVAAVVAAGTTQQVVFELFAGQLTTRPVWIFLAGAVTLLLAELAVSFFSRGTRRRVAQRREIRRLRRVEKETAAAPDTGDERTASTDTGHTDTGHTDTGHAGHERRVEHGTADRPVSREHGAADHGVADHGVEDSGAHRSTGAETVPGEGTENPPGTTYRRL